MTSLSRLCVAALRQLLQCYNRAVVVTVITSNMSEVSLGINLKWNRVCASPHVPHNAPAVGIFLDCYIDYPVVPPIQPQQRR